MVRALEFCYSSNQMSCASLMGLARRKLLATYRGFLPLNSSGWRLRVAVGRSRLRELTGVIPVFGLVRPGWVTLQPLRGALWKRQQWVLEPFHAIRENFPTS
jgi:hypothetical protein